MLVDLKMIKERNEEQARGMLMVMEMHTRVSCITHCSQEAKTRIGVPSSPQLRWVRFNNK